MTAKWRNQTSSNGQNNVPWLSSTTGARYYRIQVVLSSNPTYGDADDFLLTFFDYSAKLDADSVDQTETWDQLLPGNFSGSYYVLAKIDALDAATETVENDLTQNGNNLWNDVAGTRIAIQPSTFPTIYLASTASGSSGNGYSDNPSLTADGRYTAYASDANNLVLSDTNGVRDVFIFDNLTSTVRRLNRSQQGAEANGASNTPALSGNGRYVAFSSEATNLILGDVNGFTDIFVVDTLTGAISLQSVTSAGAQGNGSSFRPSVSHTGRYIVFESSATNLTATATTFGQTHIYLRDRDVSGSGTFDTAGNISTSLIDVVGATTTTGNDSASQAQISADGNYVAFSSKATNLAAFATTAGRQHIYLRDRTGTTTTLMSVDTGRRQPQSLHQSQHWRGGGNVCGRQIRGLCLQRDGPGGRRRQRGERRIRRHPGWSGHRPRQREHRGHGSERSHGDDDVRLQAGQHQPEHQRHGPLRDVCLARRQPRAGRRARPVQGEWQRQRCAEHLCARPRRQRQRHLRYSDCRDDERQRKPIWLPVVLRAQRPEHGGG
jgi:Tol biopolymer transport system component